MVPGGIAYSPAATRELSCGHRERLSTRNIDLERRFADRERRVEPALQGAVARKHAEQHEPGEREQRDPGTAQCHALARVVRSIRARVTSPGAA